MDIAAQLAAHLPMVRPYPPSMIEISPKMKGRSFFPGGSGRADIRNTALPSRPIMIVGQDFGTLEYWGEIDTEDEGLGGTWSGMLRLLREVPIDPSSCFFTNVVMGVRTTAPIEGVHPALDEMDFIGRCLNYLELQIKVIRPCVVVTLGLIPAVLVASHFGLTSLRRPRFNTSSKNAKWSLIDNAGLQFIPDLSMCRESGEKFALASAVHPANRTLNLRHRTWPARGLTGADADMAIWREVAQSFKAINTDH